MFRICNRINNFYVYAFCRIPGPDGSLYYCLLDSMARVQSVDDKAVFLFVGVANAHHSEWSELVSPTDRHGRDALDFFNLSGCEQLVLCPTDIAGKRLDLVGDDWCQWHGRCGRWYSTGHFRSLLCQLCDSC